MVFLRYFDSIDATGKYSKTNLFGNDGVLYKQQYDLKDSFTFATQTDIESAITNVVEPIVRDAKIKNYYLANFNKIFGSDIGAKWISSTKETNRSTGYFINSSEEKFKVGAFTANNLKYIEAGSLVKFVAPTGYHFMTNDKKQIDERSCNHSTFASEYIWTKVISVVTDGTTVADSGLGS